MFPKSRTDDLIVKELADEMLVYDVQRDKAHSLNRVAGFIWQHCNGENSRADLVALVRQELGLPSNEAAVQLALEKLSRRHLLETPVAPASRAEQRARRDVLKMLVAALALPLVMSLTAPRRWRTPRLRPPPRPPPPPRQQRQRQPPRRTTVDDGQSARQRPPRKDTSRGDFHG